MGSISVKAGIARKEPVVSGQETGDTKLMEKTTWSSDKTTDITRGNA